MAVLAKGIDTREERVGVGDPGGWRCVTTGCADFLNLEPVIKGWFADEKQHLGNVFRRDGPWITGGDRVATHPKEFPIQLVIVRPLQDDTD